MLLRSFIEKDIENLFFDTLYTPVVRDVFRVQARPVHACRVSLYARMA